MKDADIKLMEDFREGSPLAFSAVYDKFYSAIWQFIYRIIQDDVQTDDICIETFTKLFARHSDFKELTNIRAFLFIVARNTSFTFLNWEKRQEILKKRFADFQNTARKDLEMNWKNAELQEEIAVNIVPKIEKLPQRAKEIFILYHIRERSLDEIAEMMGISKNTVRNQLVRAMKLLRISLSIDKPLIILLAFFLINDNFL